MTMGFRSDRARNCFATLALLGTLLVTPTAFANGRFPRAQRFIESATDPNLLALYGTYGLIVSRDAGGSWNHICEAATGTYSGDDPLLEILPDGKIVARAEMALVRSADSWCNWTTLRGDPVNAVLDITRTDSNPLTILALLGSYTQSQGFSSQFSQSTDGGATWSASTSLPANVRGLTIDVAPSSSMRVVVSGVDSTGAGQLVVSEDGGRTWQGKPIAMTDTNSAPYLAAISKDDPNTIFLRTDSYKDINGVTTANDALLVSVDGGASWTTVIQRSAKLFGFALSPDESTLLVGYGDPVAVATYVAPGDLGIYRANVATLVSDLANASSHFEKIFQASVTCLRWTKTGLFACTSQKELGFEVGRAPDAGFALGDANPFTPLLRLPDVRPLPCAKGTRAYACYSDSVYGFAAVCGVFQTSCDASAPPPTASLDSGVDASIGGHGGAAGEHDGGRAASGPSGGATGGAATSADHTSCGCRTARPRTSSSVGTWLVVALGAEFVRRRRNRCSIKSSAE